MAREFEISYILETQFGLTEEMGVTTVTLEEGTEVEWEPDFLDDDVVAWHPVFESANPGAKRMLPAKRKGQKAKLSSNDPAEIEESTKPVKTKPGSVATGDTAEEDDSGIDPPDSSLSDLTQIGFAGPTPGLHKVWLTKMITDPDDESEDESAMGPPAEIVVSPGHYPRVRLPRDYGNWLANPEVAARKNDAARSPEDWERPAAVGVTLDETEAGAPLWADDSLSTSDQDLDISAPVNVQDKPTITLRTVFEISDYVSGDVDWILKQTLVNTTTTETILTTLNTEGEHDVEKVVGATGVPGIDVAWNNSVVSYQLIVRSVGSR